MYFLLMYYVNMFDIVDSNYCWEISMMFGVDKNAWNHVRMREAELGFIENVSKLDKGEKLDLTFGFTT